MGVKGQKVNPVGWRLGFYRKWKSNWFTESWNYGLVLNKTLKINSIIESFLVYKRFSSLNCNTLIVNTGLNKFTIIVFFYNLRVEETESIKKERKKLKFQDKFKTLYKLWHFEKKQIKLKKEKNLNGKGFKYNSIALLKLNRKFLIKKTVKFKQGYTTPNLKNKPVRLLYKQTFFKHQANNIKKISKLNWIYNDFSILPIKGITEFVMLQKFIGFSNLFNKIVLNSKLFNENKFYNLQILFVLNQKTFKNLLGFLYLYLKSFLYLRNNINNNLKKAWNYIVTHYDLLLNLSLSQRMFLSETHSSKNLNNFFLLSKTKKVFANKNQLQIIKYFLSQNNSERFRLLRKTQTSTVKKTIKNKKRFKRLKINYQKLSEIKFIALNRKLKRWDNKNQLMIWKNFLSPTLKSFQQFRYKIFKKHQVLDIFLRKLSHYLYLKKQYNFNINKSTEIEENNIERNLRFLYKRDLRLKSSLIQKNKFFKLNDLKAAFENILQSPVEIYFINTLSLLRFQSKFLWVRTQESVRKLGFNLLWQSIRLNKINVNRQGRSLLRQPFFIERRNKRLGPLLQDFVLLVLVSLITRNFKVLLKFINYQTLVLAKSKRQVPFMRLLIRLISNLGGSLVKIKGLRIQFKGRFDRWNRTKSIIYTSGSIPFQRKDIDLEYASSHGQVQKGIYGIRLWIWYGNNYHQRYKDLFNNFWYNNIK